MRDDERMKRIDKLYEDMQDKNAFTVSSAMKRASCLRNGCLTGGHQLSKN